MTTTFHPLNPAFSLIMLTFSTLAAALIISHSTPQIIPKATSGKMTVEDVRAAIETAAKRREEALRPDPALSQADMIEKWGIEVIGLQRTLVGYMLDFQFRVADLDKALPLFDPRATPYVLAERTQIKLPVPMAEKIGALRPTNRGQNIQAGKTYHILFANPDSHIKPGEAATVIIGDFKAEHLIAK